MKPLIILCLALTSVLAPANEEAIRKLDALFDVRIKLNEKYAVDFVEDARELESKEAREFLVNAEKDYGQIWVAFLKRMKVNPDLKARAQLLRIEFDGELNNSYYDLEYAEGIKERFKIQGDIVKWKKHLKELEAAEALLEVKKPDGK